jgi:exonuclease V
VQASLTQFFPISPSKEKEVVEQEDAASSPSRTMPAPAHTTLEPPPPVAVPVAPRSILHLSDTKTRRTPTLPPDEDTVTSRLQLMLYHRLLSALLRDFDFPLFWEAAGVDPARPLPERFVNQSRPMLLSTRLPLGEEVDAQPTCLNSLAVLWQESVRQLGADTIHPSMALVYRTQVGTKRKRESARDTAEAADLQAAIQASLQDAGLAADAALGVATTPAVPDELSGSSDAPASADDTDPASALLREDPELAWALQQSLLTASQEARPATASNVQDLVASTPNAAETGSTSTNEHEDEVAAEGSRILGRKEFVMDDTFLDRHLSSILAYWYGRRRPLGVPVEVSRRCL